MMLTSALAWWILAMMSNRQVSALGPYPTLEMCLTAGHEMFQGDRLFYTADQIKAEDERYAEQERRRSSASEQLLALHAKVGEWKQLKNGEWWMLELSTSATMPHAVGPGIQYTDDHGKVAFYSPNDSWTYGQSYGPNESVPLWAKSGCTAVEWAK